MAKLLTYVIITIGLMVLFNAAGLTTSTGIVLQQLGIINPESLSDVQSTQVYMAIIGTALAMLVAIAGVTIGTLGFVNVNEISISALAASTLILFISDLVSIVIYAGGTENWVKWIVFLIMAPIIFGYIITLYDWVRKY